MIGAGQKAADAACALERAAQIASSYIADRRQIVRIALLDHEIAVVNIVNFRLYIPDSRLPSVFTADAATHLSVIDEIAAPGIGDPNANQLILVVVSEVPDAIAEQIPVQVVGIGDGRWQIANGSVRVGTAISVLRDRGKRVRAVGQGEAVLRKCRIAVKRGGQSVHDDVGRGTSRRAGHCECASAGTRGQFVEAVNIEGLDKDIVRSPVQIASGVIVISELLVEPIGRSA